jgi:hypothetical protein
MSQAINITSPVGRIVMGSLYNPNTTDAEGKPLVVKSGPNAGQPRVNFFFALAIPKEPGHTHWAQTSWGQRIWALGHQCFPQAAQSAAFAWKIEDGDSQIPNKKGRKPCDNEGWPGHWILKFSGGFPPKIYRQEGGGYVQITDKDFVKPGYFVEVAYNVDGNNSQSQPGIYLNHSMVCFRAYGPEIVFGPDVNAAGFGAAPLPAGASMTPPAGSIPMPAAGGMQAPGTGYAPPAAPGAGNVPPVPGAMPSASPFAGTASPPSAPVNVGTGYASPATISPSNGIPVAPAPQFLQVPAAPAAPVKQMTALANGVPYEAFVAKGWTDAMLVANGLMLA